MTKKISLATLLFFTVWFINSACKKSTTTTGGPIVNNNVSALGDPIGTFSGLFVEASAANGGIEAGFYNTPMPLHLSTTNANIPTGTVTAVYCNGTRLAYNSSGPLYDDTTHILVYPPAVWAITGNANFPSFTYTCTTAMPTYNNGASLPSVINRNQNLTIPTTDAANYDQIIITISDAGAHTTSNLAASASAMSLVCVKDSLLKLNPTTNGSISVTLYKYNPQAFSGKNYLFITGTSYNKSNVVIQ